ncbi:2-dehydro-3-deoxyphosphogalactonate aldolase [plant metagenome]|uniref:2-dehydro-3-deoxyphosphogalactonate aldolase n=1 Tax=plant metagenome TaxID=1297885 RepID=A0A484V0D9_9ZZZZ
MTQQTFEAALSQCPLIAILRGLAPSQAREIGQSLYETGFRLIEVPLNSPQALESIALLRGNLPADCVIGAGTVMTPQACAEVAEAGGQIIVMPHSDPAVIRAAKAAGLACCPGVATPTEAFAALAAGADVLKMFPAEQVGVHVLKAWRAVMPASIRLVPVGGITPGNLEAFVKAGASGFGLGSALYKPGQDGRQVGAQARAFIQAWSQATPAHA